MWKGLCNCVNFGQNWRAISKNCAIQILPFCTIQVSAPGHRACTWHENAQHGSCKTPLASVSTLDRGVWLHPNPCRFPAAKGGLKGFGNCIDFGQRSRAMCQPLQIPSGKALPRLLRLPMPLCRLWTELHGHLPELLQYFNPPPLRHMKSSFRSIGH